MSMFLWIVCLIVIVGFILYLGDLIIKYDYNRKNRTPKTLDKIFTFIRWLLYIPFGILSGIILSAAFTSISELDWSSDFLSQLIIRLISVIAVGFCFYVIIPVLDKHKKIQSTAITILILQTLSIFGLFVNGGSLLDFVGTLIAGAGSIYVIMKPESLE